MSFRMNRTERDRAAERLARALRSGLELRWSIPDPAVGGANPFPPQGNVRSFLEPDADTFRYCFPRRRHRLYPLIRAARYLVRKLIAPFLVVQSRFNLSTISVIEQVEQRVRALEDAERALHQTLSTLEKTFLSCADHEQLRQSESLEEGFRRRVNQELGGEGRIGQAGLWFEPPIHVRLEKDGPRITRVSERIVETIFVHTHLPCPPARLLALGCSDSTNAIEMASLGFQVVGVDARPLPLRHPNFTMVPTRLDELPFEDECFDGVVTLSTLGHFGLTSGQADEQAVAEVFRVLKRGGRFILTVPFGRPAVTPTQRIYDRAQLDRLLQAFRIVERGYGVPEGDSWSFTHDEQRAAQTGEHLAAVCLLVLEKP
jgi:SAM-dependent methyltransferase